MNNEIESAPIIEQKLVPKRARRKSRRPGIARRMIMGMGILLLVGQPVFAVSLWKSNTNGLFDGAKRYFKTGDIVTILVDERTTALHEWSSEREKQMNVAGTAADPGLGAGTKNLFGRFFPFMGVDYEAEVTTENQSDRNTRLAATVAAQVVNVLPNGNLQVLARKVIRVNSEEQLIELTGNIRPEDITTENVVSSRAIADATIKVNGTLRYTNDEKPSVIERVMGFFTGLFF